MTSELQIGLGAYLSGFVLTFAWACATIRKSVLPPPGLYIAALIYSLAWPLSVPASILEKDE